MKYSLKIRAFVAKKLLYKNNTIKKADKKLPAY